MDNHCFPAGPNEGSEDFTQTVTLPDGSPGAVIGHYRLIRLLGQGGMGVVYYAQQLDPIRRDVALKLIKPGMDSQQVIARFESERQALALMDHPNIAHAFDAGTTDRGLPYFVMELVEGTPITRYCDAKRLTLKERIELFLPVCEAIQHAHHKGIIHRDIKPSNILIKLQENVAVPKVIDFGLARALAGHLTDATMMTGMGMVVGTLDYMSPEQASSARHDTDTRSDVYSLGAVLYELLTGTPPLNRARLSQESYLEILQQIRDEAPKRPSSRIRHSAELATTAALRGCDASSLPNLLHQDLDWIVMKSLEKDRSRRYSTVSELADDLRRYLRNEPVLASPPGSAYRIGKFVRRHRVGVVTTALVLLALLAGITGTTVNLYRAKKAELLATEEAKTSKAVTDFMVGIFQVSDPGEARGKSITVREVLERGADKVNKDLASQPVVRSRMLYAIGRVHRNLGLYEPAAQILREALQVARTSQAGSPAIASYAVELAWIYRFQGKHAQALELSREALAIQERALGRDAPDSAQTHRMLGILLRDKGEYKEAGNHFQKALRLFEQAVGPEHENVAGVLYHLGWLKKLTGDPNEARRCYERALAIFEKRLGPDHPYTAWCVNDLAIVMGDLGQRKEERELLQRSLDIKVKVQGPEHPEVAAAWNNMGVVYWRLGDYAASRAAYERALHIREKALGPEHVEVASTLNNLGLLYESMEDSERSQGYYERALHIEEKALGADHPSLAEIHGNIALLLAKRKRFDEARVHFTRSLAINERAVGPEHPSVAEILYSFGEMEMKHGAPDRAEPLLGRSLEIRQRKLDPGDPVLKATMRSYAAVLRKVGRAQEAEQLEARVRALPEAAPRKADQQ